ncbi:MAG: radical SAM protein [Myxococcales bacterium]|nr:radical SAM protein [Myxococcales bacterium]
MNRLAAWTTEAVSKGVAKGLMKLSALTRTQSNDALLAKIAAVPGLSLEHGEGRDSAHFFLNFLRHAERRGFSEREVARRAQQYLAHPVIASERARQMARLRFGLPGLRSLILSPTVRCNLRCEHCYNLFEIHEDGRDRLSLSTMERVVGEAKELGAFRVSVIGGEPLLRWRDLALLAETHNDVLFTVFTNGLLVTDEVASTLCAQGNVELAVSVDGPEALHERWRGEGTFARAVAAIERYVAHGGMALFAPTVTAENYEALLSDAFVDAMIERGAYMGYLHHYDMVGGQEREDWLLSREQLQRMQRRIEEIHRTKPVSILSNVVSDLLRGGCPAVRDFVHINHKGEVEPCCMVPFAGASILEQSLARALKAPLFDDVRALEPDAHGIKRCLVGENLVTIRRAVDRGDARGTNAKSDALFAHQDPAVVAKLPTCFSSTA